MSTFAIPQIPTPPDDDDIKILREYVQKLANTTAMIMKELDWLMNGNMDVKNIRANSIVAKLIRANEITADKLNVTELSAITANLGTITAGLLQAVTILSSTITGSIIQTAPPGNYPRAELSGGNYLTAEQNANNKVRLVPSFIFSSPGVVWNSSIGDASAQFVSFPSNSFLITCSGTDMTLETSGDIHLNPVGNVYVKGVPI